MFLPISIRMWTCALSTTGLYSVNAQHTERTHHKASQRVKPPCTQRIENQEDPLHPDSLNRWTINLFTVIVTSLLMKQDEETIPWNAENVKDHKKIYELVEKP